MRCAAVDYRIPGSVYFCELTQFKILCFFWQIQNLKPHQLRMRVHMVHLFKN